MADRETSDNEQRSTPSRHVPSAPVPESPKTTIRWDEGLKADAERCAKARGIPVAEFVRQSITHYVAWTSSRETALNENNPERSGPGQ